jgi:DNA uptake protein ComE-like DNA-binding protein
MNAQRTLSVLVAAVATLTMAMAMPVRAQVGSGLLDLNTATEAQLTALPHMTPAVVSGLMSQRPFPGIVEAHAFLTSQGLTAEQAAEVYRQAFIHVNLNTGTRAEILLIPGAGDRMAHEFDEYRPWVNFAQFDKEIGKYVDQAEVDRLKQYVFIPVDLNAASDEDILSIPGAGRRMVREFKEYRPWKTKEQFEREIGKYVDEKEVARLWRYVVIK